MSIATHDMASCIHTIVQIQLQVSNSHSVEPEGVSRWPGTRSMRIRAHTDSNRTASHAGSTRSGLPPDWRWFQKSRYSRRKEGA